jgi:hypothetical protein
MADEIRVLGETFEQVVAKSIGADYESEGNVVWPTDPFTIEAARDYWVLAVPSREDMEHHRITAADYQFMRRKGFVLGPPHDSAQGSREDWVPRGYVGVYRLRSAR